MRHWYLLARSAVTRPRPASDAPAAFVAWGGPPAARGLTAKDRWKMFGLGVAEITPLGGSYALGGWGNSAIPLWGWITMGVALSLAVCWLLRRQTPPTVIHAVSAPPERNG